MILLFSGSVLKPLLPLWQLLLEVALVRLRPLEADPHHLGARRLPQRRLHLVAVVLLNLLEMLQLLGQVLHRAEV